MKCPKCGNKLFEGETVCSNCGLNLSFTTNDSDTLVNGVNKSINIFSKIKKIFFISISSVVILLYGIFNIFATNVSNIYVNGFFGTIDKILGIVIFLSLIAILVSFFIKKNSRKILIAAIICFLIAFFAKHAIQIEGISLYNYSNDVVISIGSEDIPSLYSVVGSRKITVSNKEKVNDPSIGDMNVIYLIYSSLSEEDKKLYEEELIKYGFKQEEIIEDGETQKLLFKNNSDNTFYVVSIDGLAITYTTGTGDYKDIIGRMN